MLNVLCEAENSYELKIKAGRNNCIRLVTAHGEQFQLNVEAISDAADRF